MSNIKAKKASDSLRALVEASLPKPKPKAEKTEKDRAHLISEYLIRGQGKELLASGFTLDSTGLWHVYGQDQSCGGMFDREQIPDFGLYEGRLFDVLNEVVVRPGWNGWGSNGGKIVVGEIKRPRVRKV